MVLNASSTRIGNKIASLANNLVKERCISENKHSADNYLEKYTDHKITVDLTRIEIGGLTFINFLQQSR